MSHPNMPWEEAALSSGAAIYVHVTGRLLDAANKAVDLLAIPT